VIKLNNFLLKLKFCLALFCPIKHIIWMVKNRRDVELDVYIIYKIRLSKCNRNVSKLLLRLDPNYSMSPFKKVLVSSLFIISFW